MRVLVVDDHPLVRSALEMILRDMEEVSEVLGAASVLQARDLLSVDQAFDLVLVDLMLGDGLGLDLLRDWREQHPELRMVMVSASERPADVQRALDSGAAGFIPKRASNEVLVQALRRVMAGEVYRPPMLPGSMFSAMLPMGPGAQTTVLHDSSMPTAWPMSVFNPAVSSGEAPLLAGSPYDSHEGIEVWSSASGAMVRLTPRQSEVLEGLMRGDANKVIARRLRLSVETIKDHVAALLRVLGVSTRMQAVAVVKQRPPRSASLGG